ncbi:pentatricopeptide repeat-containing protein At2g33680-like [Selaginella moellendorffii]|uniref:pentatricopeptide repeat-containing protein At2g33680-like n=1 Tax=Selaginella moellendorffii TaxID=88036 RepID=UPI000D1C23AB|nr:pentatricopeptide repeat-containing protein At2g33680-like [Selaginella moellendorffii]|eukprot:XP_024534187.1 pentatricopeptide repeat-containing protein At2g33680-like [Selaginella moellendorffii]
MKIHAKGKCSGSSGSGASKSIKIYENLRRDGLQPSISIVLAALKVCIGAKYLATGARIHSDLADRWSSSIYVANNLISMYARCGSMADARLVFQSMQQRALVDLVSWNAMIQGYSENGDFESALRWFLRMKDEGFQPDGRSFVAALKACASIEKEKRIKRKEDRTRTLLEKVREIHRDVSSSSRDTFVANTLIEAYGSCGSLEEAVVVFESMEEVDLVSWTSIIVQCVENGKSGRGLEFFDRMVKSGFVPDGRTLVAVLKACEGVLEEERGDGKLSSGCLGRIREIHSRASLTSSELDLFVANTLVGAYARAGSLDDAREVFDKIIQRDPVSWTKMLLGYVDAGEPELALELYSRMRSEGSTLPSEVTVVAALKACSSLAHDEQATIVDGKLVKIKSLEKGMAVHADQGGFLGRDTVMANSLVDFYSRCKEVELARRVFDGIQHRTTVSWNSMMMGCVENDEPEVALELYASMHNEEEGRPNKVSVLAALKACGNLAAREQDQEHRKKHLEKVAAIHSQALRSEIEIDTHLGSSLVDAYARCGSLIDARSVFQQMKTHDTIAWNSLILAYVDSGDAELGLKSYLEMKKQSCCSPDRVTYLAALKACGNLAALETGRMIHKELHAEKLDCETKVVNALVDFYGKCGSLVEAQQVFDEFPAGSRNLVTWNSLMAAYGNAGEVWRVLKLLETMIQHREEPDSVTFMVVLSACNHAGLVEQGQNLFEAMSSEFGIWPSIEHCCCVVDLLCRANRIEEAVMLVTERSSSFCSPSSAKLWMAILCACYKASSNVEFARIAFKAVVELDEKVAGAYVLMASMEEMEELKTSRL